MLLANTKKYRIRGAIPLITATAAALAITALSTPAAADCSGSEHLGTCINSDTLWPHPGPTRFQSIGSTETTPHKEFSFGLVTSYSRKPIVLRASNTNPNGDVPVLDHMITSNILIGFGLFNLMEINVALPTTLYQTGDGLGAFTGSESKEVTGSAMRDIRFGAAFSVLPQSASAQDDESVRNPFSLALRFELGIPTGDSDWFGGDRGVVPIPSAAAEYRMGRLALATEIGARFRKTSQLAGARVGNQGFVGIGAGFDALPHDMLTVALEAYALPVFANQKTISRDAGGDLVVGQSSTPLIPAEWMASLRSVPNKDSRISFSLGFGTAIPFTESAMTAPEYRIIAGIRFDPKPRPATEPVLDFVGPGLLEQSQTDQDPGAAATEEQLGSQGAAGTDSATLANGDDCSGQSAESDGPNCPGKTAEPDPCAVEPGTPPPNTIKCPCPEDAELAVFDGTTITYAKPERFERGSSRISPAMETQLVVMARRALAIPNMSMVVIETYADTQGASERNESLASDRADAISRVLLEAGMPSGQITVAVGDLGTRRSATASQFDMTVQTGTPE